MHSSHYVGDIGSQQVYDLHSLTKRALKIYKGNEEVSYEELISAINELLENTNDSVKEDLISLYVLACDPDPVNVGVVSDKLRVSAFILGIYIGRFMSNTKSTIRSEISEADMDFDDTLEG